MTELPIGQNLEEHPLIKSDVRHQSYHLSLTRILCALFLTALLSTFQSLPAGAADSNEWRSLLQGRVVVKQNMAPASAMPSVEAKILVPREPEKVWIIVSNPEKLMHEETKVKSVKILSRESNKQQVAFSVYMTRLFPAFNYILEQELLAPSTVKFHRLSGSFRDIQGFWRLTAADDGRKTILTYHLKLDPGPLIPHSMLLLVVKSDLPNMMQSVRQSIEHNIN